MNKERLKKVKILFYPYRVAKKVVLESINFFYYITSLYYIKKNKKRVQKKIDNKEVMNAVFVVQYIPGWNKLEPVYNKMKDDVRFNPIIVCVPLNIQDHKLMDNKGNDTYKYFEEHGYTAIDALNSDGSWYDLKQLNPDYLFHSRPYNHFMPVPYTSGKIVKYALICNILYGLAISKNGQDVCLNKDYYRDVYMYFSLDETEKSFYENRFLLGAKSKIQKCFPFGGMGLEQILCFKQEKEENGFKKTVLWTPRWSTDAYIGGSNFFNYKDLVIELAKSNQDILFILRPHPLMFDNFIKTGEMTREEVDRFKEYCERQENIILDESKEYVDKFWNSDVLITDLSSIFLEYFITEKPIIYCHSSAKFQYTKISKETITACYEVENRDDLLRYFNMLITCNDKKKDVRKKYIDHYFGDVKNNSSNVIKVLLK